MILGQKTTKNFTLPSNTYTASLLCANYTRKELREFCRIAGLEQGRDKWDSALKLAQEKKFKFTLTMYYEDE